MKKTGTASVGRAQALARRRLLGAARSWGYQLRIRDLALLAMSTPDVLVIDHGYAARHMGKIAFEPAEIARLKTRPDGSKRLVLAYMSIGEAEQYRYYWQGAWCTRATAPPWIGAVNPNWPGNYPVRFWYPEWQRLILDPVDGYLARIQAQGFDGVYLDRADVYGDWSKEHPRAEREMIDFLAAISGAAHARNPRFLVVMQNAEELLRSARVRQALDGVAKEDLLYGINFSEAPNPPDDVAGSIRDLQRAQSDKLPVFTVEYLSDPSLIEAARQRLLGFGFIPTFAPRLLDSLGSDLLPPGRTGLSASAAISATIAQPTPAGVVPPASWAEGAGTCLLD